MLIYLSLICAITGHVVANILTESGMFLWPVYDLLANRWHWPEWVMKPLMSCAYCVAGQWAVWSYLCLHWYNYDIVDHFCAVILAIFIVDVIRWLLSLSFDVQIVNKINNSETKKNIACKGKKVIIRENGMEGEIMGVSKHHDDTIVYSVCVYKDHVMYSYNLSESEFEVIN